MVRMEKKAVNKVGLIIIIVLAVAALGGGIFFIVKNHNNLDFSFPWSKSKEKKEAEKKKEEQEQIALERQKIDISTTDIKRMDYIEIEPVSMSYDDTMGYVIKLKFVNKRKNNFEIEIYNIEIDGYQIDFEDKFTVNNNSALLRTFTVSPDKLDLYGIETFKKLRFYLDVTEVGKEKDRNQFQKFVITNSEIGENTQTPTMSSTIGNGDKLKVEYYKKEEDNDFTNIYFLATNSSKNNNGYYNLTINSYKVNNEILTNNDFNELIYDGNKKIVVLRIPKSKFKSVDSLTISFFVLRDDSVYMTKSSTLEFKK